VEQTPTAESKKIKAGANLSFKQKYQFCTEKSQFYSKLIPKNFSFSLN
jgi:hypothetical protein